MLINPPIDKLIEKVGCKYALVCLITRRSRFLLGKKPDLIESSGENVVTFAAKELQENKIRAAYED